MKGLQISNKRVISQKINLLKVEKNQSFKIIIKNLIKLQNTKPKLTQKRSGVEYIKSQTTAIRHVKEIIENKVIQIN